MFLRLAVDSTITPEICLFDQKCDKLFEIRTSNFEKGKINNVNFDTGDTKIFSFKALGEAKEEVPDYVVKSRLLGTDFDLGPISVSPTSVGDPESVDRGTITIKATNQFADISLDLDSIATFFLTSIPLPSLGFTTPEVPPFPPRGNLFKYDIFDATNKIKFNVHQKLTFDTDVLIKLEFSKPVSGVTGSFVSTTTTVD